MSNSRNKPPAKSGPRKETGMLTERVELTGPDSEQKPLNPAVSEEETLLPHERDQTTKPWARASRTKTRCLVPSSGRPLKPGGMG